MLVFLLVNERRLILFRAVVPGSRRDKVDYHNVEQEAGRAVLKLLDAKIGKFLLIQRLIRLTRKYLFIFDKYSPKWKQLVMDIYRASH